MTEITQGAARTEYLLEGRRVTVADLVESGLLQIGTVLVYRRPRIGETHRATVTANGRLRLDDGQEFTSSSRAASEAAGLQAVDGWHAWVVEGSGTTTLDTLRQALLDQAAETSDATGGVEPVELDAAQGRHQFLRAARTQADEGAAVSITVRDLIARWGAKGRGHRLNQRIEAELANHGLVTSPNFRKVTLDASVSLITVPGEDNERAETTTAPGVIEEADELDVGLTVGNLPSALGGVVSVPPTAAFDEAITQMLLNDYSQLAVLSGPHTVRGAVTWKSIAKVRHAKPGAILSDAIVHAREVRYDQELIDVLPVLTEDDFVLVRDEKHAVAGIVTTADVAMAYGELATPFFFLGELDQLLRWIIAHAIPIEDVIKCCDPDGTREIRSFDDLTFGDYQRIFESPSNWMNIGWPLHRPTFVKRLDEIREIRNDVMHFNPDPLPPGAVDKLHRFLKLLREVSE
jgi:predicted transcriptional regulator